MVEEGICTQVVMKIRCNDASKKIISNQQMSVNHLLVLC